MVVIGNHVGFTVSGLPFQSPLPGPCTGHSPTWNDETVTQEFQGEPVGLGYRDGASCSRPPSQTPLLPHGFPTHGFPAGHATLSPPSCP